MNSRLTDTEHKPLDYAPLWWIAEQEAKMRCTVCGDDDCGTPDFCDEASGETLRGQQMLVGAILAAALICTLVLIHFAARYFA